MNVRIAGLQQRELTQYIRKHFPTIKIVRSKPDFVLCYGGDGTLLYAERLYPGIPKVMIRNSRVCTNCARLSKEVILELLSKGQYALSEQPLLEAKIKNHVVYGLNDVIVAHAAVNTSLRYNVLLDQQHYGGEYLGDGVIVATALGSTGYYQSVTHSTFQDGLGVAFNNTINNIGHLVVTRDTTITVKVNRGPGVVVADNAKKFIPIDHGETVQIKRSYRTTYIAYFKGKHYRQYNVVGENRVSLGYCQICKKKITDSN
ncbi:MAG: NAD(+)/NADH kinase [Candidatus Kerfeldbacteria bacterium]|nr:NAD(+)/NADH kinase [Candidatus Kerfeldbacteria bacterium]